MSTHCPSCGGSLGPVLPLACPSCGLEVGPAGAGGGRRVITVWRDDRCWARWVAVAAASAASWTVLNTLGVAVAEAYTAPPALLVIAVGGVALRVRTDASSWRALAAGVGLLVTPTAVQVVEDPGDLSRLVAVIVGDRSSSFSDGSTGCSRRWSTASGR